MIPECDASRGLSRPRAAGEATVARVTPSDARPDARPQSGMVCEVDRVREPAATAAVWIVTMHSPPPAVAQAATWTLAGLVASDGRGHLDLASPAGGLTAAGDDRLLGLDLRADPAATRLVDHWTRGDDLVAVYEPSDPRRLRATAMWRSLSFGRGWELIVSAQTSLVESDSTVAVTCELSPGSIAWGRSTGARVTWQPLGASGCPAEATCLIVRRGDDAVLIAVHPADVRRMLVTNDSGRVRVTCWLFTAAIEKGVLLRSRVLAAQGPAADLAWAEALVTELAAEPPPLSA